MLAAIGLVVAGFVLGVLLAGMWACFVIGIIHREAVSIVDSHMVAMTGSLALHTPSANGHSISGRGLSHGNE